MADLGQDVEPTPYPGWTMAGSAFDQSRDPNGPQDQESCPKAADRSPHGLVLVELDATIRRDDQPGGMVQWIHERFATEIDDPKLADLIAQVTETVRARHDEQVYL